MKGTILKAYNWKYKHTNQILMAYMELYKMKIVLPFPKGAIQLHENKKERILKPYELFQLK